MIRYLPALLFLGFALYFNPKVISMRLSELDSLLDEAAGKQAILNNATMLGKFELLGRRLEQGESRVENYGLEARIQAFTVPDRTRSPVLQSTSGPFTRPLRAVLNALRFALGKDAIHPESIDKTLDSLETAYLHERSRNYAQALTEYSAVLPGLSAGSDIQASALLHFAFCESMPNRMAEAREILTRVIAESSGKEEGVVAWKLLGFIDEIEDKRSLALPGKPTDLDRAKQRYLLVDYSSAINLLDGYVQKNKADPRLAEAYYYRARAYEELGDLGKAIDAPVDLSNDVGAGAGGWQRRGAYAGRAVAEVTRCARSVDCATRRANAER